MSQGQPPSRSAQKVPTEVVEISSNESETLLERRAVPSRKNLFPSASNELEREAAHQTTTLDIEEGEDSDLKNLDKFDRARENVFVKAGANVQYSLELTTASQRLQRFVNGPKYGKRAVKLKKWANELSRDTYRLTFISDPKDSTFAKKGINIPIPTGSYTLQEAQRVRDELIKILDRLPVVLTDKVVGSRMTQQLLLNIATETALPGHSLVRHTIGFANPNARHGTGNKGVYQTYAFYFDESTFEPSRYMITVPVFADSSGLERIPKVPDTIKFSRSEGKSKPPPTPDDDDEKKCHAASIALAKFLSWKMTGVCGSKASMDELRSAYEEQFGIRKVRRNKLEFYKGKRICEVEYSSYKTAKSGRIYKKGRKGKGRCVISPSKYVKKDVIGALPNIVLKTGTATRFHHVIKTMHEAWVDTQDIKTTWEAGCRAGDRVNEGSHEESLGTVCSCDEETATSTSHLCDRCDLPTLCCDLSRRWVRERWCPACEEAWLNDTAETEQNVSLRRMRSALQWLIKHEEKKRNNDGSGDAKVDPEQFKQAVEVLEAFLDDPKTYSWRDGYNSNKRVDTTQYKLTGPYCDPFLPSVEAPLPLSDWKGRYSVHAPNNITVTALWINKAKSMLPPAILGIVGDFCNSDRTTDNKKTLLDKANVLHEITSKTPYVKAKRLNAPFDSKKLQQDQKEWVEGILLPSKNQPWQSELYKIGTKSFNTAMKSSEWRPRGVDRLLAVVHQIEERFEKQLPRRNGCPYFLDPAGMPDDWTWGVCWYLIECRIDRMKYWCNKKWETIDTIETIFLECIWQVLDPTCGDLFGIPITIWVRHPLRFAVDHLVHGKQMRTRWTTESPQSIEDRDDSLNNILIESAFTNRAKSNIPNERYVELQEDMNSMNVEAKWFKRSPDESSPTAPEDRDLEEFPENIDDEEDEYLDWDDVVSGKESDDEEEDSVDKSGEHGWSSPFGFHD